MKRFLQFILFVFLLSSAVSALYVWKSRRDDVTATAKRTPEKFTAADAPAVNVGDVDVLAALSRQQIKLASAVIPSVVSIRTQKNVKPRQGIRDPWSEMFERFMSRDGQNRVQQSLGSGVIVSKEGHIVTNNHVIDQMDAIEVQLHDGRKLAAKVIGVAPANDLAILKVENSELHPIPFGDSEKVEVGEIVFAVGNPFGLEETLTQGIISAKGRRGVEADGEFFQTDAAINPGNSGGALINVRGELVGINTAIYSQSGGSQGIGFAIPSRTVRRILDSVLKNGRVIRGYLGVTLETLTPAVGQSLGVKEERGAIVTDVTPGSPADTAGLKQKDVIVKFNDRPVKDIPDLRNRVAEAEVDTKIPLEVVRGGQNIPLTVQIKEMPENFNAAQPNPNQPPAGTAPPAPRIAPNKPAPAPPSSPGLPAGALAGVDVIDLNPRLAARLDLPPETKGVVVNQINPDSAAADVLRDGDMIEEVNQSPVATARDYERVVAGLPAKRDVMLSIVRDRARSFVVVPAAK
jgi:serine protease Do